MVIVDVAPEVAEEIDRHIKDLFDISLEVVQEVGIDDYNVQSFAWYQMIVHIATRMLELADNVLRTAEVRYNGGGTESQG